MIRIDHVNIVVADLERSAHFYMELLGLRRGFEATLEGEWIERVTGLPGARARCVFLETDEPSTRLELLQYLTSRGESITSSRLPNTSGVRHLAFTLSDAGALDSLVTRLRNAGVELLSDPVTVPFVVGSLGRKRLCYFLDPDDTLIEISAYEPLVRE
jgi:glyoxylase I family protein